MEQRVALLVAAGRTNAEVASGLGLSATTVDWHLSRALRKLGVRSRDDLAALLPLTSASSRSRSNEAADIG